MLLKFEDPTKVKILSDPHFNHNNIIKYSNRPFSSAKEMDEILISNINKIVDKDDFLICAGDWLFPGRHDYNTLAKEYREAINCKTIYFVRGNHDRTINDLWMQQLFRKFLECDLGSPTEIANLHAERSNFIYKQKYLEFEQLFTSVFDVLTINVAGKSAFISHYAHKIWSKSHHGCYHLYGHSHNSLLDDPNAYSEDIGVDAVAFRLGNGILKPENYRPTTWTEIENDMSKKIYKPIDHHGEHTNG